MTDISSIIDSDIIRIDADSRISQAIRPLKQHGVVFVFNGDDFMGAIAMRRITRTRINPAETKVDKLVIHPPKLSRDHSPLEAAKLMIDSDLIVLPVEEDGKIVGMVRSSDLFRLLVREVDSNLMAREVMSSPVMTLGPNELLSTAAQIFQRQEISRIPIVENEEVIGLLTVGGIVENMLNHNKADIFLLAEHQPLQNAQIRNAMDRNFATEHPGSPLTEIADRMSGGAREVLLHEDGMPDGILTQKDVLEAFLLEQEEELDLRLEVAAKGDLEGDDARHELESFANKYKSQLGVGVIKVTIDATPQQHRGKTNVNAKLRIHTDKAKVSASGEGWGVGHAVREAMRKAEKQFVRSS